MQALVTQPGVTGSTRVADVPEATGDGVLVRMLEVGVCGTDREISEGLFGIAPEGEALLVLGHEALGSSSETATASRAASSSPRPSAARAATASRARRARPTRA